MNDKQKEVKNFDEVQSLEVIKEMIKVSQKNLQNDGILFIVWGWIFFILYFFLNYLPSIVVTTHNLIQTIRFYQIALPLFGLAFTIYYIYKRQKKVTTYIGISLSYVWISLFVSLVLVNLIQFNILNMINFELQHPIFMVFISFATVVTGGILRYKPIIIGGITFAMFAYLSSFFELREQLLFESIAWLIAFIIPGHLMYSKRKK